MCCKAFGNLAAEGIAGGGRRVVANRVVCGRRGRIAGRFSNGQVERGGIKQGGAHIAQSHFRENVPGASLPLVVKAIPFQ
jgi:hypothetical protein